MECIINGRTHTFETAVTISSLLDYLDIEEHRIVIEHNGELIKKEAFSNHIVQNNDRLELLEFVGGG